jgi:pilus assembly protein Flp/PilA
VHSAPSLKNNTQLINEVGKMNLQTIKTSVLKFIKDEDGLTIVEYAVAGGLITVAAVGAFITLGTNVNSKIECMHKAVGVGATKGTAC